MRWKWNPNSAIVGCGRRKEVGIFKGESESAGNQCGLTSVSLGEKREKGVRQGLFVVKPRYIAVENL